MVWLITQIWSLLAAAFVAGFFVGRRFERRATQEAAVAGAADAAVKPTPPPKANGAAPDDLTQIIGLDAATAAALSRAGVVTIGQIAGWTPAHAAWIEQELGDAGLADAGRIARERWIEQAASLRDSPEPA